MFDKLKIHIPLTPKGNVVVFNLVVSTFLLAMMWAGNGQLTIELIFFTTLVCTVLTKLGELALRTCCLTEIQAWLPMAFVVGFAGTSLLIMALTFIIDMTAFAAFWICALLVLSLTLLSSREASTRFSTNWADPAVAFLLAMIIGLLVQDPVSSPKNLLATGVLPIWSDYLLHGITITSFGSSFFFGSDMELVGVSRVFYHYGPFMIPAAFQAVSGMSGLALSTSLLLPLGLLIAAFGTYVFAVELGGRLGGLFALTAIICLSTPSLSLIQSGWFDFYWMLFTAPGTGHALGVSTVVCTSIGVYLQGKNNRVLAITLLLLFSLILIRIQMFMLLAPSILLIILLNHWPTMRRPLIWVVTGTLTIGTLALGISDHLKTLWVEYCKPYEYLNFALRWSPIYDQQIKPILEYSPGLTGVTQILVVLLAVLGVYFFLYPLLLGFRLNRYGFQAMDILPLLLITSFVVLMLFAPPASNGDLSEYKHRHFPLLYVIIAIYAVTYAFSLVSIHVSNKLQFMPGGYALVGCLFLMVALNVDSNPARPNVRAMPWASAYFGQPIAQGLLEAVPYIKTHARQEDVLAMDTSFTGSDPHAKLVQIVSLTGIPAFIARSDLKMMRSQCVKNIVKRRLIVLQELTSTTNWPNAQQFLQTHGIRWFLAPEGEIPKWDTNREFAVFSTNRISVWDTGHPSSKMFTNPHC